MHHVLRTHSHPHYSRVFQPLKTDFWKSCRPEFSLKTLWLCLTKPKMFGNNDAITCICFLIGFSSHDSTTSSECKALLNLTVSYSSTLSSVQEKKSLVLPFTIAVPHLYYFLQRNNLSICFFFTPACRYYKVTFWNAIIVTQDTIPPHILINE